MKLCTLIALIGVAFFAIWMAVTPRSKYLALPSPSDAWRIPEGWDEFPWLQWGAIVVSLFTALTSLVFAYDLSTSCWLLAVVFKGILFTVVALGILVMGVWTHANLSLTYESVYHICSQYRTTVIIVSLFLSFESWRILRNFVAVMTHNWWNGHRVWPPQLKELQVNIVSQ